MNVGSASFATLAVLSAALAGPAPPSAGSPSEERRGMPFFSPDGRRVVRLSLQPIDERLMEGLGLDQAIRDQVRAGGPSLRIEFSRVDGDREFIIRSFTGSAGAGERARYRVLWDDLSRRFLVLCSTAPAPSSHRASSPPLWMTGEIVAFYFDRITERYSPMRGFEAADWEGLVLSGPSQGVPLPLVAVDLTAPEPAHQGVRTGEIRFPMFRAPSKDRILNFTIHPNTQNLRDVGKGLFAIPPVRAFSSSPDGRFTAKLAGERDLMVLLAEGARYRDEVWVLLFPRQMNSRSLGLQAGLEHRLLWSRDSRHLLVVTRDAPVAGLDRLPDGAWIYLLFDTREWRGEFGPRREGLEGLDLPGLGATR